MLSKDEVKHIAGLARVGLDEKEIKKFSETLSSILDWVEQLKEVDISGVEPTAHITGLENVAREDVARDSLDKTEIIALFPDKKDNYDKVKSIL